jgi:hypothetical protein
VTFQVCGSAAKGRREIGERREGKTFLVTGGGRRCRSVRDALSESSKGCGLRTCRRGFQPEVVRAVRDARLGTFSPRTRMRGRPRYFFTPRGAKLLEIAPPLREPGGVFRPCGQKNPRISTAYARTDITPPPWRRTNRGIWHAGARRRQADDED